MRNDRVEESTLMYMSRGRSPATSTANAYERHGSVRAKSTPIFLIGRCVATTIDSPPRFTYAQFEPCQSVTTTW